VSAETPAASQTPTAPESGSPNAAAADFAKYAMKVREQALLKVEQIFVPESSRPAIQRYAWKNEHRDHGVLDRRAITQQDTLSKRLGSELAGQL